MSENENESGNVPNWLPAYTEGLGESVGSEMAGVYQLLLDIVQAIAKQPNADIDALRNHFREKLHNQSSEMPETYSMMLQAITGDDPPPDS